MPRIISDFIKAGFKQILPCLLCGIDVQQKQNLCEHCWNNLPWSQQSVHRHELEILSACEYHYPLDRMIQQFKYEQQLHYQQVLAGTLMQLKLPRVQAIVPMPISVERLRKRGFNQSVVIAKHVSKQLNIPIWQPIIRKHQHSQKGLSRIERLENIDQQFEVDRTEKRRFRKVLIIDDVVTTGSSIHALSSALYKVGCKQIYAACIAAAQS
ncbi:amidophosphoribosyltransferase [Acinetobacter sp. ANC 5054]|uniref:ComF family protein n=1 Tax=Acinetobacter sp. ANC 5054 TaxID=1977877 RepID=UPI000A3365CB|nr:phosphoribosyltransferase family protein [Acinetobacter sp. ANC 5054]OTG81498.1 amidophosphoribosyltransferase [Acinetobacter sp. ANC 5054]